MAPQHNNWSMITNTGQNLLSPGKTPKTPDVLLHFFVNTIRRYTNVADLQRASISFLLLMIHRLGSNECATTLISICLGHTSE